MLFSIRNRITFWAARSYGITLIIITTRTGKFNYTMERFFETVKTKVKTLRTFQASWSAPKILDGFVLWYNFIRPHMALENETPSEKAGFLENLGLNRWLGMIRLTAQN